MTLSPAAILAIGLTNVVVPPDTAVHVVPGLTNVIPVGT